MAKRKAPEASLARSAEPLYRQIRAVLECQRVLVPTALSTRPWCRPTGRSGG
jgi:hypothetical protein